MNSITGSLKTALFTTGKGALSVTAYKTLKEQTDLSAVVFSRRKTEDTIFEKLKKYGLWYAFQYAASRVFDKKLLTPEHLDSVMIEHYEWSGKEEANKIIAELENKGIRVIIICGFHYVISKDIYSKFDYMLNIHPSYLPVYRGPDPIAWGMWDKSRYFGLTIHHIDEGIDTGRIIRQYRVKRPFPPLIAFVVKKLAEKLESPLRETLEDISRDSVESRAQESGFYLPAPTLTRRRLRKSTDKRNHCIH